MRAWLNLFRCWKNKKTKTQTHSLPAPCSLALCMAFLELYTRHAVTELFAAQKHGVSLGKTAHAPGDDVGEDAARAPLACLCGESTVY